MKLRRRWTFAVLALALAWMLFARGGKDASVEAADDSLPTGVLRDIAATDSGGISWATYTTAGRAYVEQPAAARFSTNSGDRSVDIATDAWKLRIELDRITSIVCVYLPGMGSAAEIQASRFNLRVEFRGADGRAVVAVWYDNDRGRQFDEVCNKHDLPGELDGVR